MSNLMLSFFQKHVHVCRLTHDSYKVSITFFGKEYSCVSTNRLAFERINSSSLYSPGDLVGCYTLLEAYRFFYGECLENNGFDSFYYL